MIRGSGANVRRGYLPPSGVVVAAVFVPDPILQRTRRLLGPPPRGQFFVWVQEITPPTPLRFPLIAQARRTRFSQPRRGRFFFTGPPVTVVAVIVPPQFSEARTVLLARSELPVICMAAELDSADQSSHAASGSWSVLPDRAGSGHCSNGSLGTEPDCAGTAPAHAASEAWTVPLPWPEFPAWCVGTKPDSAGAAAPDVDDPARPVLPVPACSHSSAGCHGPAAIFDTASSIVCGATTRAFLPGCARGCRGGCDHTAIIYDTASPTVDGTAAWPILRAADSSGRLSDNDRAEACGIAAVTARPVFLARSELPGHAADRASHPARVPLWPPASSIP